MARSRGTAARNVRVVLLPSERTPAYDPTKPDPRLLDLVRLLARQAARDFVEAEWERTARDHLHK